jgi:hypothetical protein
MPKTSFRKNSDSPLHWHGSNSNFLFQQSVSQTSEFCCCSFSILLHFVELTFSTLSLVSIKILLLLFPKPLEYCRAYFLRNQLGKYRNPLLLFRRLIFSTSALDFSHQTLIHSTQILLFQQQFYFPLMPSQKAITPASQAAVSGAYFAALLQNA